MKKKKKIPYYSPRHLADSVVENRNFSSVREPALADRVNCKEESCCPHRAEDAGEDAREGGSPGEESRGAFIETRKYAILGTG